MDLNAPADSIRPARTSWDCFFTRTIVSLPMEAFYKHACLRESLHANQHTRIQGPKSCQESDRQLSESLETM